MVKTALRPCPFCVTYHGLDCFRTGACSGTGKQGQASLSAYSASKFGIRALTQCAGACFFPGSGAVRVLKRFRSLRVRSAPHYRQRLCSRTRQDTNVYVSSPSSKNMFLTGTYQGTISSPRLVVPQECSRSRYAWSLSASTTLIRMFGQLSNGAAVGYVGMPADVAQLVGFLASKESHLITGQSVSISAPCTYRVGSPDKSNLQISIDGGRFFD